MAVLAPGYLKKVSVRDLEILKPHYNEEKNIDYNMLSFNGERGLTISNRRIKIIIDSNDSSIIEPYICSPGVVEGKYLYTKAYGIWVNLRYYEKAAGTIISDTQ